MPNKFPARRINPDPWGAQDTVMAYDSIDNLEMTARGSNALRKAGITTIGELTEKTERDLLSINNLGKHSLHSVKEGLADYGLSLSI